MPQAGRGGRANFSKLIFNMQEACRLSMGYLSLPCVTGYMHLSEVIFYADSFTSFFISKIHTTIYLASPVWVLGAPAALIF